MTTRIDCDVNDTHMLLGLILKGTESGERVMFIDEPGRGMAKMQAVRVRLSRVRGSLRNQGRKRKYFMLHSEVFPYTENGKRKDCVVVWRNKTIRHSMIESLENLVGHGEAL